MNATRRAGLAVAVAVALFAVTGCSAGGTSEADTELPTAAASATSDSATESDTAPALPAGVPVVPPERPEDEKSRQGAKAFGKYVLQMWWYTYLSNDSGPMSDLAPEGQQGCEACRNVIETADAERANGWAYIPRGDLGLRKPRAAKVGGAGSSYAAAWDMKVPPSTRVDRDTGTVLEELDGVPEWYKVLVDMEWRNDRWQLVNFKWDVN